MARELPQTNNQQHRVDSSTGTTAATSTGTSMTTQTAPPRPPNNSSTQTASALRSYAAETQTVSR